jgi:hypothetical protein
MKENLIIPLLLSIFDITKQPSASHTAEVQDTFEESNLISKSTAASELDAGAVIKTSAVVPVPLKPLTLICGKVGASTLFPIFIVADDVQPDITSRALS